MEVVVVMVLVGVLVVGVMAVAVVEFMAPLEVCITPLEVMVVGSLEAMVVLYMVAAWVAP